MSYLNDEKTLCTYRLLNKGVQVCTEDLGHGLLYEKKLVGVLSSPAECNGSPAIYTRVGAYISWIEKTISN